MINSKSRIVTVAIVIAIAVVVSKPAIAEVCDWRPSQLLGGGGAGATVVAGSTLAATGTGLKIAGFYTLTHSITGATMLGSAAGGASAAGTVGIMGGTGAGIGTLGAILMSPVTIGLGAILAIGTGGLEGVCYLQDDRITEYADVLEILRKVSSVVADSHFTLKSGETDHSDVLIMKSLNGDEIQYQVENLYIVNGILLHRDWFKNTVIGSVVFSVGE